MAIVLIIVVFAQFHFTAFDDFFIIAYGIFRLGTGLTVVFASFIYFGNQETLLVALLTELLARFFVFLTVDLDFHMTHNDPLNFGGGTAVLLAETGFLGRISPDFFGKICLGVSYIKLARVGSGMHHKLLVLVVVRFGDQVGDHVRVLGQKCLVVDLFPLESLTELGKVMGLGGFRL